MAEISEERIEELLEQATVDCYDEEEEFSGVVITLLDNLHFPLQADVLGERVEIIDVLESASSLRKGVVVQARKDGKAYPLSLSEVTIIDPDAESAELLAMYHYWARH